MDNNIAIAQLDGLATIVQSTMSVILHVRMVVNAFRTLELNAASVLLVGPELFVINVQHAVNSVAMVNVCGKVTVWHV